MLEVGEDTGDTPGNTNCGGREHLDQVFPLPADITMCG